MGGMVVGRVEGEVGVWEAGWAKRAVCVRHVVRRC